MATKLPTLVLFFFLLAFQVVMMVMPAEASLCEARSKYFKGLCFHRNNCDTICQKEGFLFGKCRHFKCMCEKDCNVGGGGGGIGGGGGGGGIGGGEGGGGIGGGDPGQGGGDGPPNDPETPGGDGPPAPHRKSLPKP